MTTIRGQDSSKLLEAARHSAILVAVVSPAYVAPGNFTLKELEVFCNASQARGLKDPLIFIIEYLPIESEHRHPQLKGRRAYQFWMKRNDLPVPFTFGSTLGEEPKVELFKVAKQIIKRLEENRLDIPDLPKPITRYLGKRVLLGQVTDDLVGAHNELRRLPGGPWRHSASAGHISGMGSGIPRVF